MGSMGTVDDGLCSSIFAPEIDSKMFVADF